MAAEQTLMDYVNPHEAVNGAREAALRKASLPIAQMLLRGALAGAFLGYATSLALQIVSQGSPPILGAIFCGTRLLPPVNRGANLARSTMGRGTNAHGLRESA